MTRVQTQETPLLKLTPPEIVEAVVPAQVKGAVPLPDDTRTKVNEQLDAFLTALKSENVVSDAFRTKLDAAFSLGRKEIADATTLSNEFTKGNFVGETETPAYKAISEMRTLFDELNPANQGDLFSPTKVLGVTVPFGNKLTRYLRRYEAAEGQIGTLYEHIASAKDEVGRGVAELARVRQKMWGGLEKLEAVAYFIGELDNRLSADIEVIRMTDPNRARALEQEVLYYVRQNLGDVQAAQALTINAYNIADELRKTGREVMNGCDRVQTLGIAALSIAVTLARATGVQIKTMRMLEGAKVSIEGLILATGTALQEHVKATTDFASNPLLGVQMLQQMFDSTFKAMDVMDNFRSLALTTSKANNDMLRGQLTTQMQRISSNLKAGGAAEGIAL